MPYRDEVMRVTLPQVRAQFTPRDFRTRDAVSLRMGGAVTRVALLREPSVGAKGNIRTWFSCPGCGRRAQVVGLMQGSRDSAPVFACSRKDCGAWYSRKRTRRQQS